MLSVLLSINICNGFLFSDSMHLQHDNVALNVMRAIGIWYVLVLVMWTYYALRVYSMEYMIGYIVDAQHLQTENGMQSVAAFKRTMTVNLIICQCIGYPDIASLISLFLFHPQRS